MTDSTKNHWIDLALWPGLLLLCIAITAFGIAHGERAAGFATAYALLVVALWRLERVLPHQQDWLRDDGQMWPDLLHTAVSKAAVFLLVIVGGAQGWFDALRPGHGWWPGHWPLPLQVALALAIAEFGFYWAHRVSHEWAPMWPYHAIHHSVRRLWFFNTGRFHLVDTARSLLFSLPLLLAADTPQPVLDWVSAITAFVGLLTHCNVRMRTGLLDQLFTTPHMHRWHHAPNAEEGNTNYGENLLLWDRVFGTWYRPANRQPPRVIGIADRVPDDYVGQVLAPFHWRAIQAEARLRPARSAQD